MALLAVRVNTNDLSLKTQADLWVLPMTGDRKPVPFLSTPFHEGRGQFSPDGKWVAYTSDESGGNEVYVQSFPAGGAKWPVRARGEIGCGGGEMAGRCSISQQTAS